MAKGSPDGHTGEACGPAAGRRAGSGPAGLVMPARGMEQLRQLHEEVYRAARAGAKADRVVFVAFNGRINSKNLGLRALQDRSGVVFEARTRARSPEEHAAMIDSAAVVLAAEPDHPLVWQRIQGAEFHARVLEMLDGREDLARTHEFSLPWTGKKLYMYQRGTQRP